MNELACIPTSEKEDFGALPPAIKENFRDWSRCVMELDSAERKMDCARRWASHFQVTVNYIFTKRTLYRKRGWRALVDWRDAGRKYWDCKKVNLPPPAVAHLKKLMGDYERSSAAAARAFLRQWGRWRNGDLSAAIPGFAECPRGGSHPPGWSKRNLMRYLPSKFELAAKRRGQSYAVGKYGPQVFSTRKELYYMSHVMFDDVWHDNFVNFGRQGLCRVLELDALDVYSGALAFWGCKPRLKRADKTFDQKLTGYMGLAVAGLLGGEGYAPRGTIFMCEHGAAAMPERVLKICRDNFGLRPDGKPLIDIRTSGITGEEQAIIGYRGKGKGNSRFKACLESHHNLKHNELSYLPAQTGQDRDHRPEQTHGILSDDSDLLKAMAALARQHPQRAAQLRLRTLDYHNAFLPLLMHVYEIINERDWHSLEGWDEIPGNVEILYRMAPDAEQLLTEAQFQNLPALSQQCLLAAAAEDKRYLQRRRLSPADVQRRERKHLLKAPDYVLAELIGFDFAREEKLAGAYFDFDDAEIASGTLRYENTIVTPRGQRLVLPDDKYLVLVNPFDPSRLYVFDAGQSFLGTAPRQVEIDRNDPDALRAAHGHQAKRLKELTAPLLQRHAADIRAETKRLKENADLLTTPEVRNRRDLAAADVVADQLARSKQLAGTANPASTADEEWD